MKDRTTIRFIIAMLCGLTFMSCHNPQNNFWNSKNAYLGQTPPGDTPEIFAKGILDDSCIVLGTVAFSADGKAFYYSYAQRWFDANGSGTKQIVFKDGKWQKPKVIAEKLANPSLSSNGKTLYVGDGFGVWTLNVTENECTKPELWIKKAYGLYNFQATNSGTFYMGSDSNYGNKYDYTKCDFSTLTISDKDTVASSLGKPLNTDGFDGDFFIAPDESYIIISTKETKTFETELWISFRLKDGSWSEPKSLGDKINNGLAHRFGQYVSPDGKYLFYTWGTSEADSNIYWVRFDTLLEKLKPKE
jgi:hypothetical protein